MTDQGLDSLTPADYLRILRHRKFYLVIPAVIVFVLGVVVVMSLPSIYRSSATVLIESQQIPDDFVRSAVTSFADERIEVIKQRVLTTDNLLPIVEKFGLYADQRARLSPTELANLVREGFTIELVSANAGTRTGRTQPVTIAFNINFDNESPAAAQKVVNELVTLFLAQDATIRTTKTRETQEFLAAQARKLGEAIASQEKRIADFKTAHRTEMPDSANINQNQIERLTTSHRDVMGRMQSLRNTIQTQEAQLTAAVANAGAINAGGTSLPQLEQELARLLSIYTEKHPDVIAQRERVEAARKMSTDPALMGTGDPAVASLRSQLSAARSELDFLVAEKAKIETQITEVEARINSAPEVERQYNELIRDMDNLSTEYQQVKSKALESEIAVQMETEQKGERFKLIEAPALPTTPASPDRPKLLAMVLFVALGAGGGVMLLAEMLQPLLRGARSVTAVMGDPPLATVPFIETAEDLRRTRRHTRIIIIGIGVAALLLLLVVQLFVTDLGLMWYSLIQKLGGL